MFFFWFWFWLLFGLFFFIVDVLFFLVFLFFMFSFVVRLIDLRNLNFLYWLNLLGLVIFFIVVGLGNFFFKVVLIGLFILGWRICLLSLRRVVENFVESSVNECFVLKWGC